MLNIKKTILILIYQCNIIVSSKKGVASIDWNTMIMYYDYYDECVYEGIEPKNFWDWYYEEE